MSSNDTVIGLRLDPLDVLFFRDGRPFEESTRASSGLPYPQTLAGALRTALLMQVGFDFSKFSAELRKKRQAGVLDPVNALQELRAVLEAMHAPGWVIDARFRGPWLALFDENGSVSPLLPVPWTLFRLDEGRGNVNGERWLRADPWEKGLPGWDPPCENLLPLWHRGSADAKRPGGFLTPDGIGCFLRGGVPSDDHWLREEHLFAFDARTGIAVDRDTFTAQEHMLYTVNLLALKPRIDTDRVGIGGRKVGLYCEVIPPSGTKHELSARLPTLMHFGGEGRYVTMKEVDAYNWRGLSESAGAPPQARKMWLLATPGLFHDGNGKSDWRPNRLAEHLRAAASGNPVAVSGWDIARCCPKPTRFAVPAGSVYFTDGVNRLDNGSLCDDAEDIAQGWGFALQGVWPNGNAKN
ncbi:MAG: type III-B CRISPR module-associated protein Cmr3 [Planctomycetota bacterium]|nr:MAG: type III-B CRISPR module-associated protein Cmr3 [Planctomycetota bacterium]